MNPINQLWEIRLADLKKNLEANQFEVHIADNVAHAKQIAEGEIFPGLEFKSISWGGSQTFISIGLYDSLKTRSDVTVLDTYDKSISPQDMIERRRQSLLVDLFITGTNAITESGELVNLDMIGNRVGAIMFGPRNVLLFVGRNKITPTIDDAFKRVKEYAAPVNTMRLNMKTPCTKTGRCMDCNSPSRICNYWTVTQKSFPKNRIKIVLINEDLGF